MRRRKSQLPEFIRTRGLERPIDVIDRPIRAVITDGRPGFLATDDALKPQGAHQALDRAAGYGEPFALELPPDLARAVDLEVLVLDPTNLSGEGFVPLSPWRQPGRVHLPRLVLVIG